MIKMADYVGNQTYSIWNAWANVPKVVGSIPAVVNIKIIFTLQGMFPLLKTHIPLNFQEGHLRIDFPIIIRTLRFLCFIVLASRSENDSST